MITKNKLSKSSTSGFGKAKRTTKDWGAKRPSDKKWFIILPLLLVLVAGITFGIIMLLKSFGIIGHTGSEPANDSVEMPSEEEIQSYEEENRESEIIPSETGELDDGTKSIQPITAAISNNPTINYGRLMLINPNYTVEDDFISARKGELISLYTTYGILELNSYNGDNLLDPEAASYLSKMLDDYSISNPGQSMQTVSCFRSVGTNCGRLCAATGTSDHHTGLTCDLIDPVYGTSLDTDQYDKHIEWQWLRENSYKYGFIDRFPEAWAGGSMNEPINVDAKGSTGLFETWHYRYVGVYAATEIAQGVYNNGEYDSLEHYLLARNLLTDLLNRH